jgi:hypothetical protein
VEFFFFFITVSGSQQMSGLEELHLEVASHLVLLSLVPDR